MLEGEVFCEDGVAVLGHGDAFLVVYQRAARVHRTRWLFQRFDEYLANRSGTVVAFMIVLPTSDPPDAATRVENSIGLRRLGGRVRRLTTTPVGDAFRISIVRTVMRALAVLQGKTGVHFVTETIDEGIRRVLEAASPSTPSKEELMADVAQLYHALGVELDREPSKLTGS
jgi:hypothetical protein